MLIAAGTYRETVDLGFQKTDAALTIEGAGPSTVLTGADVWSTGWTSQADGSLVHSWPYQWGMKPVPSGWTGYWNWDGNGYKRDILRRSEMIYVNGSPLRGVLTLAELSAAGTFYVDEAAAKVYMRLPVGVNLTGSTIEVGMRVNVLKMSGRRNVTLRNFSVMRNRGGLQDTAAAHQQFTAMSSSRMCRSDGPLTQAWARHLPLACASEIQYFPTMACMARGVGAASTL